METLKIDSREPANHDTIAAIIRNAERLFIAGGDQSNYMRYWRGTKTAVAINFLLNKKRRRLRPYRLALLQRRERQRGVAGALREPIHPNVTLYYNDFLKAPFLQDVITDQHDLTRVREGRSVIFLARIFREWNLPAEAIAVEERTAMCSDDKGRAKGFGLSWAQHPYSYAYFIATADGKGPETVQAGQPLTWDREGKCTGGLRDPGFGNRNFHVATFQRKTPPAEKCTGGGYGMVSCTNKHNKT